MKTINKYIPFHVHTIYSTLDGCLEFEEYVSWAKTNDIPALSITDHGTLAGVVPFANLCHKNGINPLVGSEFYLDDEEKSRNNYHILLMAKNMNGYKNLVELNNRATRENFHYKPRLKNSWLLDKKVDDVIITNACMGNEIGRLVIAGEKTKAAALLKSYYDVYGDDYYIEIQFNELKEQHVLNQFYLTMAKYLKCKLVLGIDAHYLNCGDHSVQQKLYDVQRLATGKKFQDIKQGGFEFTAKMLYLKTTEVLYKEIKELGYQIDENQLEESILNINEVNEKCSIKFGKELKYPPVNIPVCGLKSHFINLCIKGLKEKYNKGVLDVKDHRIYIDRIKYEVEPLMKTKYIYLLIIMYDILNRAREAGIIVGPGRGSSAGCFCSYLLGIVCVNPIEHDLLFERFCNADRVSPPDVDSDFSDRDAVIQIIRDMYGEENVLTVANFMYYLGKSTLRDLCRIEKVSTNEINFISKLYDNNKSYEENMKEEVFKKFSKKHPDVFVYFKKVMSKIRNIGTHASAVIIVPDKDEVPILKRKNVFSTQSNGKTLENQGYLKLDILGLNNLKVISETVKMAGTNLDIYNMDLKRPEVYEEFKKGNTVGIFQCDKPDTVGLFQGIPVTKFDDIMNVISVIRPGLDRDLMVKNYNAPEKIQYLPGTENIVDSTYGVLLYQEQVMKMCTDIAGFSMNEADNIRKIIAKKEGSLKREMDSFVSGAVSNGYTKQVAQQLWQTIEGCGVYIFNKSHACVYGYIAYITMYLKVHHSAEFFTAWLQVDNDSKFIHAAQACGIEVVLPDVNKSSRETSLVDGKIYIGFTSLKGIEGAANSIINAQPYTGLEDFVKRVNSRTVSVDRLDVLAQVGAFDEFNSNRAQVSYLVKQYVKVKRRAGVKKTTKKKAKSDSKYFGWVEEPLLFAEDLNMKQFERIERKASERKPQDPELDVDTIKDYTDEQKRMNEMTFLGYSLRESDIEKYRSKLPAHICYTCDVEGKQTFVAGQLVAKELKKTKTGKPYARIKIEDEKGVLDFLCWQEDLVEYDELLQISKNIVVVVAKEEGYGGCTLADTQWQKVTSIDKFIK